MLRALSPVLPDEVSDAEPAPVKVNSHVHLPPNFSAFHSVAEAVDRAAAEGVRVLGASNYYDYAVYDHFAELCRDRGIFPLFGTEVLCLDAGLLQAQRRVNDPVNPGKMYVCGKGITHFAPMAPAAERLMAAVRRSDSARTATMVSRLSQVFSERGVQICLDERAVKALVAERYGVPSDLVYLQERHVALAFQEALFATVPSAERARALSSVLQAEVGSPVSSIEAQDAIRTLLMKKGKPGYVEETFIDFDRAYQLVLALGGVPCYPVLADGASPVAEFESDAGALAKALRDRRIYAAELIPNRNTLEVLRDYVVGLRAAGIAVLAGTEHNTLEMVPLEPNCARDAPVPVEVGDVFWEGACIVAAHQYLVANGQEGYVDSEGNLSGHYQDGEARLKALGRLGAAVIEQYFKLTTPTTLGAG